MTGLIAAALGVCAVAIVALAVTIVHLRSRVDSLSGRVEQLLAAAATTSTASTPAVPTQPPVPPPAADSEQPPAHQPSEPPVTLITDMAYQRADAESTPRATQVVSVTLARPLIRAAALSSGLQYALREESRMRIGYAVRRELKRQRRLRRRRSRRTGSRAAGVPAQSRGWTS
jgi:hypothetical protein